MVQRNEKALRACAKTTYHFRAQIFYKWMV